MPLFTEFILTPFLGEFVRKCMHIWLLRVALKWMFDVKVSTLTPKGGWKRPAPSVRLVFERGKQLASNPVQQLRYLRKKKANQIKIVLLHLSTSFQETPASAGTIFYDGLKEMSSSWWGEVKTWPEWTLRSEQTLRRFWRFSGHELGTGRDALWRMYQQDRNVFMCQLGHGVSWRVASIFRTANTKTTHVQLFAPIKKFCDGQAGHVWMQKKLKNLSHPS